MKKSEDYDLEFVLVHELAHSMDGWGNKYSGSQGYEDAFEIDLEENFRKFPNHPKAWYVSHYAHDDVKEKSKWDDSRVLAEDFAETVRLFFTKREILRTFWPEKEKYLSNLFGI